METVLDLSALHLRVIELEPLLGVHQHLLAVGGDDPGAETGRDDLRILAIFDREDVQLAGLEVGAAVEVRSRGAEEQVALDGREAGVIIRVHRDAHHAVFETVEIDDDGFLLLFLLGLVVLLALLVALLLFRLVRLLLFELDLVALRREQRLHVLPQGEGIDAIPLVAGVVPLEVGDLRRVMALRDEEQIIAFSTPDRRIRIEEIRGDLTRLAAGNAPDEDARHAGLVVEAEGEVPAVGRPLVVERSRHDVVRHLDLGAVGHGHHEELAVLVRKGDVLAVR